MLCLRKQREWTIQAKMEKEFFSLWNYFLCAATEDVILRNKIFVDRKPNILVRRLRSVTLTL